ncbi:Rieske (2Fe-2S) protein [Actinomycetospora sp. TBRC 11914]|uniref:Rieske (2Fe-2S) protein n=1 Tax=Actinomycetospora sp. TBRC 11914 TaxID=2729387 RepID=UPI00145D96E1|nr:Rieske (2Fe-2S) protein [Actinomycetospora sp. TBRC 11914]NMO93802.1 Rieske (2Fe-2S) protein [Actinomycetospora sp. TBRC 11914]
MTPDVPHPGRRTVLLAACAGLAACGAAACAEYGSGAPPPAAPPAAGPAGIAGATVPVGGGVVLADRGVVVTQPVAGTFAAFGTTCPHQGCSVDTVADGTITCPCHGSRFRVADGGVAQGPATRGLTPRPVRVVDGQVIVG